MNTGERHLTDAQLLSALDGELSAADTAEMRNHLDECAECSARLAQIESTATAFVRAHRGSTADLPSDSISRAQLQAQMALETNGFWRTLWGERLRRNFSVSAFWPAAALLITCVGLLLYQDREIVRSPNPSIVSEGAAPLVPDANLTPGAVAQVSLNQICRDGEAVESKPAPAIQRAVFHEYGMDGAPAQEFEVDHLITPGLGGTDDIRNLWPESYSSQWNAHVKDELEDHLHELVCQRKLDLRIAQHDMASDWISAYKKYFGTDRPLLHNSDSIDNRKRSPNG